MLLAVTGLVVAYVRNVVQYRVYMWSSLYEFLGWWFFHYVAVVIFILIAFTCISSTEKYFLRNTEKKGITVDQALIYIPIVIISIALSIIILYHWPEHEIEY